MPTYEYRCAKCDRSFEWVASISVQQDEKPSCPSCGGKDVERVYSNFFARTSRKS